MAGYVTEHAGARALGQWGCGLEKGQVPAVVLAQGGSSGCVAGTQGRIVVLL